MKLRKVKMDKPLTYIFTMICAVILTGCNSEAPQEELPDAELVGTLWTLQAIEVAGDPDILPGATKVYNIQFFDDYSVEGRIDCNTHVGFFAFSEDSRIKLDHLVTTLVGCRPPELGYPYYQALRVVVSYEIRGNTLRLYSDMGSALKYRDMD